MNPPRPSGYASNNEDAETGWTFTPPRADVLRSLAWAAVLAALFFLVYGFCNWLAATRSDRWRLWFDWEGSIPFVPWMIWAYLSLFLTFFLPMFALRGAAIDVLCRRLALAVLISGIVFLALPAEAMFERPATAPNAAYLLLYALDLPHNLVPSLHVSWGALLLGSLRAPSPVWIRRCLEAWFLLLCISVLLTHQHHLVDVAGGILVAYLSWRMVPDGTRP